MPLPQKYGPLALVAGASQGLGAAFATHLAAQGMDLVLIARRPGPLEELAAQLRQQYGIQTQCIPCDLAQPEAAAHITQALGDRKPDLLVYNAALSYIGPFEQHPPDQPRQIAQANMLTPMALVQALAPHMLRQGRGAIVLMASLAGFQGSGFLASYAASKAWNRTFAESLWYEWQARGVDVMACCAGATATPNFIDTKPEKTSFFAPKVQSPEAVVRECLAQLGRKSSCITGRGNRIASFFMQRLMPRKTAIKVMGDTTRKMYRL